MKSTLKTVKQNRGLRHGNADGLSRARLREVVRANDLGQLVWITGRRKGRLAGTRHADGYVQVQIDKVCYMAHTLIWMWHHGDFPDCYLTHVDGDRTNNRLCNLEKKHDRRTGRN